MGFISFKKTLLTLKFISLWMPYPNTVILTSSIATQATPLLRPILLFIINGALIPLLRPILLFIVNGALIPLLRPILLFIVNSTLILLLKPILFFIVNSALIPLYYYKITSLQYLLPLSTFIPILIYSKYSLLLIYL